MSPIRTVWLVAMREVRERLVSRSFQISTVITLLVVVGVLLLPRFIGDDEAPSYTVGVTGDVPDSIEQSLSAAAPEPGTEFEVERHADRQALETAILEEDTDIGVIGASGVLEGPDTDTELLTLVTAALQETLISDRAAELGLSPGEVSGLFAGGVEVDPLRPDDDREERTGVAFIGTILLFVSIVTYGQWILIGVVEEKTSRVVEVILGAVPARHLLTGKVVGIGLLGLAQLVVIAGIGIVGVRLGAAADLPEIGIALGLTVVAWFLIGFTFYAAGYAVAGSLVSRQEDAQNASFPLTLVMLVAYFVAISSLSGEDNPVLRVLSVVPPFSPITMPIRQATGAASVLEIVLSVALMMVATVLMLRLGGRVYAGGLLRTGGRVKIREALRGAET